MTRKYECMTRFSWTDDRIHLLKKLSKITTAAEAAKIIGCCYKTLYKGCRENQISFRKRGKDHHFAKVSFDDIDLIFALKEEGIKQCVIAEKFEVSSALISMILNYHVRTEC